jgi:NAD(P)-dependent dehydrogenase (short-subunit alcohol dehydrogenase family)
VATNSLFDLTGKVAFVTGAASGLGWAMAEVMAEYGATVTLADVDEHGLEIAERQLKSRGYNVESTLLDISNSKQLHAAIDRCADEHGKLDIVFANAGISAGPSFVTSPSGQIDSVDPANWDRVLKINLSGTFDTMRTAAKHMKRQKSGRIIVTASISGMRSSPISGYAYVATKAALINLVRHAAVDLAPYNVLVNAIAPGCFMTNIGGGKLLSDLEVQRKCTARVPLGRLGSPEEIKGLALFLAAPASSYVTGTVIPIDGGVTAR